MTEQDEMRAAFETWAQTNSTICQAFTLFQAGALWQESRAVPAPGTAERVAEWLDKWQGANFPEHIGLALGSIHLCASDLRALLAENARLTEDVKGAYQAGINQNLATLQGRIDELETENARLKATVQPEVVAWAAFSDNGNIRVWTSAAEDVRKLAESVGMELVPLGRIVEAQPAVAPEPAAVPDQFAHYDSLSSAQKKASSDVNNLRNGFYPPRPMPPAGRK